MSGANPVEMAVIGPGERRASFRQKRSLSIGSIVTEQGKPARDCTIIDVGMDGARIMVPNPYDLPDHFTLVEPKNLLAYEARVVWRRGVLAGISFDESCSLNDDTKHQIEHLRALALEKAAVSSF